MKWFLNIIPLILIISIIALFKHGPLSAYKIFLALSFFFGIIYCFIIQSVSIAIFAATHKGIRPIFYYILLSFLIPILIAILSHLTTGEVPLQIYRKDTLTLNFYLILIKDIAILSVILFMFIFGIIKFGQFLGGRKYKK